jgi:hypothetical protein
MGFDRDLADKRLERPSVCVLVPSRRYRDTSHSIAGHQTIMGSFPSFPHWLQLAVYYENIH